jgi:hypothetical protein
MEKPFMSMTTVAYARRAYKSFSRSARHLYQLIASHQNLHTGWAYVGYDCLAEESSLTPRRVMQLVAFLEMHHAIDVRRGHGRGHVNFYRVLREEDGSPVPQRSTKQASSAGQEKVKCLTPPATEKVKCLTRSPPEKVKSETHNIMQSLRNVPCKEVETKTREKKEAPLAPMSLALDKPEMQNRFWCDAHGFCHSERLPDHRPDCVLEEILNSEDTP